MKQTALYNSLFPKLRSLHLNLSSILLDNCDYMVLVGETITCRRTCRFQMEEGAKLLFEEEPEIFLRNLQAMDLGDWEVNYQGDKDFRWSIILEYDNHTALTYTGIGAYPDHFLALLKLLRLEEWLLTLASLT